MKKKRVIIGSPIAIAGITLILVTKLSFSCQPNGSSIFFFGLKEPVSLVVSSPSTKKAFEINGREIPLNQLIQEIPHLASMLGKA
jgi:uncharacterized spore protein YtfJ